MAIAASRPVYDEQQNLLGVVSVDLFLSHLSNFLQNLEIGKTGQGFIMERSGLLVASSAAEKPFTEPGGDKAQRRLYANESANPLIRYAAEALIEGFGDYHHIMGAQYLEFEIEGQRQFLQISPVKNEYGLDWLIVVVIPEADFMAQINTNNRITALLVAATLAIAVIASIIAARWISRPIRQLNASAQTLAQGKWTQPVSDNSWIGEISELTQSFNWMAGQLQQMVESLTSEVAERKRVEISLQERLKEIEVITASVPSAIWKADIDESGNFVNTYISETVDELLGLPSDTIKNDWQRYFSYVKPPYLPAISEKFKTGVEKPGQTLSLEYEVIKANGETAWFVSTGRIYIINSTQKSFGFTIDITEYKRAEAALRESNHHLEAALAELKETQARMVQQERLAAVGQLAAGIAHDFNNILTSILGYAELLHMSPDTPEAMHADLTKIIVPGQQAAHLVRQILDFSRKSIRQPKQLDLVPFIKELIKFLERTIPETIRFSLEIEPGEYLTEADPAQMRQMLTNLVLNAGDAMPAGGELRVTLSQVKTRGQISCAGCNQAINGEWLSIAVADTGSGIPPEVAPHIFEPFFTTKDVGQGSGLGLSQVLGIIQQHGGHIGVNSQVGQGTTFTCYLPPLRLRQNNFQLSETIPMPPGQGETSRP
jgi:PAS domain S-box-containing protein